MLSNIFSGLHEANARLLDWCRHAVWAMGIVSMAFVAACSTGGSVSSAALGAGVGGRGGSGTNVQTGGAVSSGGTSAGYVVTTNPTGGSSGDNGDSGVSDAGDTVTYIPQNLASMRLDPINPELDVVLGQPATLTFHAYGVLTSGGPEVDITNRTAFYVPDRYLIGTFPNADPILGPDGKTYIFPDGNSTFTTRLPAAATDPVQQGGVVTVQAQAMNGDGTVTTVTTTITVKLTGSVLAPAGTGPGTPALPANPQTVFQQATASTTLAPTLVYPNDGVMLPPNLQRLETHWKPATGATLYEIEFAAATVDISYYARCPAGTKTTTCDPASTTLPCVVLDLGDGTSGEFDPGSCAFELDAQTFGEIAESTRGYGPLTLTVRATDEKGHVGTSKVFNIEFAETGFDGTVYYWMAASQNNTIPLQIVRFAFGSLQTAPESILTESDIPQNYGCVGCHALSRDGTKMAAGLNASFNAALVYINDLAKFETTKGTANAAVTYNGALGPTSTPPSQNSVNNRVLMTSFAPDGNTFVGQPPNGDTTITNPTNNVCFHDGTTGIRRSCTALATAVGLPSWSPDGKSIALTAIQNDWEGVRFTGGSIVTLPSDGKGATSTALTTIVPYISTRNRYSPDWFPDSSLLLYTEAIVDPTDTTGYTYDAYTDQSAKTWVVAPQAGATPVFLANAAKPGVNDGTSTDLMNTYPRAIPAMTPHRGGMLYWYTSSSQRRAGLRKFLPNQPAASGEPTTQLLLWMFALDPSKVTPGSDPSYTGFFLPFQDLTTSNHMAAWTVSYASQNPPPQGPTPLTPPLTPVTTPHPQPPPPPPQTIVN